MNTPRKRMINDRDNTPRAIDYVIVGAIEAVIIVGMIVAMAI